MFGLFLFNKKAPDLARVRADYVLTATTLYSDFVADEASATQKYVDKVIQVTGTITAVEVNADNTINITLGGGDMGGVICTFQSIADTTLPGLASGNEAVIKGVCSGMLMDVLLNNCVIVSE
jgi:hypothetical protein